MSSDGSSRPAVVSGALGVTGAALAGCGAACGAACAPPILALLGFGAGAGGALGALSALRPLLLLGSVAVLALGFWRAYRAPRADRSRPARWPLWLAGAVVVGTNSVAALRSPPAKECDRTCPPRRAEDPPCGGSVPTVPWQSPSDSGSVMAVQGKCPPGTGISAGSFLVQADN